MRSTKLCVYSSELNDGTEDRGRHGKLPEWKWVKSITLNSRFLFHNHRGLMVCRSFLGVKRLIKLCSHGL